MQLRCPTLLLLASTTAALAQPLAPSFAPAAPPGMIALTADSAASTLDRIAGSTHGQVTTGLDSQGGHGIAGEVAVPIVPGRVLLEVGGGTGRTPIAVATPRGARTALADSSDVHVAVRAHVSDDLDVSLAYSQQSLKLPGGFRR